MQYPTVSIIIATLNSSRTLEECLSSIRAQTYPQNNVEIILVDGGSSDTTVEIGNQYNAVILTKKGYGAEAAKAFGLKIAKGEIVADFGSDNIIPDTKWLRKLLLPFSQNADIVGSYPLRYTYRVQDTVFNRYVGLFGINDPVPFYLKKADRQSYLYTNYALSGSFERKKGYYSVTFTPETLPTVGANGFFIRKQILKQARVSPKYYSHIDVIYDVVEKGYDTFAVVDTGIIHDTADTLFSLVAKRKRYMKQLYLEKTTMRRYHVVDFSKTEDVVRLGLFVLYSVTFIEPVLLSIRGYIKKPDIAWFVHPLFCFMMTVVYAQAVIEDRVRNRL